MTRIQGALMGAIVVGAIVIADLLTAVPDTVGSSGFWLRSAKGVAFGLVVVFLSYRWRHRRRTGAD